jgi:6,7-dimethyl-8-ribityllumazine synthase
MQRSRLSMGEMLTGGKDAGSLRFAIVVSRFNEMITGRLLDGALQTLRRHGADLAAVTRVEVPGAWEIPVAARHLADSGRYAAVIALGCVIRGDTPHFEYVAGQAAEGLMRVSLDSGVPIGFGVLTTENLEQALDRAGGKAGNKGAEAAEAALEMANLIARIGLAS